LNKSAFRKRERTEGTTGKTVGKGIDGREGYRGVKCLESVMSFKEEKIL